MQNNPFARPFIETASALNIVPFKSAFENATYHIRKEDVTAFLSKLQDVVGDYRAAALQAQATQS
jgi:cell division control protein 45